MHDIPEKIYSPDKYIAPEDNLLHCNYLASAAITLGSQVRMLLGAWMCVCVSLCCVVLCR
jgi:hypothetical protein